MSGIYGTVKPANINPNNDVEMFYFYRPTRSTTSDDFSEFKTLDTSCLVQTTCSGSNLLGLFNLRLPLDKFNKKGIYTIYIRPRELFVTLTDVSVLQTNSDIKGVVFKMQDGIIDYTGYRIEYMDSSGNRKEDVRMITSSNPCVPVYSPSYDGFAQSIRYKLSDTSSDLYFCTVTPSVAGNDKVNYSPYIGSPNETVVLTNTKFDPIMLEIELVDHDADTISYMLEGDQVRDRDNSIITTYNDQNEIYMQQNYYTIKSNLGTPLYDVKEKRSVIDGTQAHSNIINQSE